MNKLQNIIEKEIQKQRQLNLFDLRLELTDEIKMKICDYIEQYNLTYSIEEVYQQILINDLVAIPFMKSTNKQQIYKKISNSILKTQPLPATGKNSIRFNENGEIVSTKTNTTTIKVDYIIGNTYYIQRYTNGVGGSQNRVFKEVEYFLKTGGLKYSVGAFLDGDYWDIKRNQIIVPNVKIRSLNEYL